MKKGIHPEYKELEVTMANGETFMTRSTLGVDKIQLDVDPTTHAAWVGGVNLRKTGRMEKFSSRFGDVNFAKKKDA